MMDCKDFREAMDLYLDGELAEEAAAAADLHLAECERCRMACERLRALRTRLQEAVRVTPVPATLEARIRAQLFPRWRTGWAAALALLLLAALLWAGLSPAARGYAAGAMESVAFRLDPPRLVELEGQLICRDCELKALYGAGTMCLLKGHRAALKTPDGKIWNLMEGEHTELLLHEASLRGRSLHIRGRLYRRAGCVEVQSYRVLPAERTS